MRPDCHQRHELWQSSRSRWNSCRTVQSTWYHSILCIPRHPCVYVEGGMYASRLPSHHHIRILTLHKKKGAKSDCENYRGISLVSTAGKILARILLNRIITSASESTLPEARCGFSPGLSTIDMVFAVRQVKEKCIEQQMDLYSVLIDLMKAFDTVNREALWTIL